MHMSAYLPAIVIQFGEIMSVNTCLMSNISDIYIYEYVWLGSYKLSIV